MTLITFQDGKPVLRDGKVGTEQACCCGSGGGGGCPQGCPSLDGCTLRVYVQFDGLPQNYREGALQYSNVSCQYQFTIEDGEIDGCVNQVAATFTFVYGEDCCPVLSSVVGFPSPQDLDPNGNPCYDFQWELICPNCNPLP